MYKGINQDFTPDKLQDGLYYYAKNVVISDHLGSVVNELGNEFVTSITAEQDKTIFLLGLYTIEDITIVFSVSKENFDENFDDSFGDSVIGVFYNNQYTEIIGIREYDWAFSTYFPIQATGHKNNKEEFVIAFTDNFNIPRIINIGKKDSFSLQALNENETLLYPNAKVSSIVLSQIEQGGVLKSGRYYVSYLYEDSQGNTVKGFNVSNGVSITKDTLGVGNVNYNGVIAGTETNKSLKIIVEDADTQYKFISFYIIQIIDGITSVVVTEKQPLTSNFVEKIYTGNETTYDATIEEVLIGNAHYTKARTITAHNKALYVGNLETEEEINLQPFVNNIQINPTSKLIDITNLTENQKTQSIRGFMHDEVYAFYIRFWIKGKPTRAYHIPGRPAINGEKDIVNDLPFFVKNDTSYSGGFSSMGFWENQDELYPEEGGFPTELGLPVPVRHHKFPSISKCKEVLYQNEADYGKTKLDILGIEVNFAQSLPIEFDSWEILYAKREEATTIGTDLLLYTGNRQGDTDAIWTTGGNWNVRATKAGTGSWDDMYLRNDYIRLHNFELLYTNTSRLPDYIKTHCRLTKRNLNANFLEEGKEGGRLSVSGDTNNNNDDGVHNDKTAAVIDYTSNNTTVRWTPSGTFNLSEQLYVENNLVTADYLNFYGEKTIVAKIDNPILIGTSLINTNSPNENTGDLFSGILDEEDTYLVSLHYLKTNIYVNFYRQQLVSTGQLNTTSFAEIFEGDTFIGEYSFITTASINGNIGNKDEKAGILIYRNSICESIYNVGLRNEGNGEKAYHYYPVSDIETNLQEMSLLQPLNVIGYNKDYSALNIFVGSDIYNPYEEFQNKFPYRIARSEVQGNENTNVLWKTWKSNNYYETEKSAGEITNLVSFFGRLLIHHYFRLYTTVEKTTLETTNALVALGTGDIFRLLPEAITGEAISYAGSQQTHTPFIFKGGYVFIDSLQGKVFLLTQGFTLQEISNTGLRKFFNSYLPVLNSSFEIKSVSFWVSLKIEKGDIIFSIPLKQGNNLPFIEDFILIGTTNYSIRFYEKDYFNYTVTLDLTTEEFNFLKAKEIVEVKVNCLVNKETNIVVDNNYQNTGYSLGYDEQFNRLLLSKNVQNTVSINKKTKKVKTKYDITVPIVTVNEIPCSTSSISVSSGGGAGITDYKINNYQGTTPFVILAKPQVQLDAFHILVKEPNEDEFTIRATSSVFAEGNYGVVTNAVTITTSAQNNNVVYIQNPVQGFDPKSHLNINGDSIDALPFLTNTNILFDQVRFLDGNAVDASFQSFPATSSDYADGYNSFYIGSALTSIPSRYQECKDDLATVGYNLDTSGISSILPSGQQLVWIKSIPQGSEVIVRVRGAKNTGWDFDVLEITTDTTCYQTDIEYETQEIEVETEENYYELFNFCFTNLEYANGQIIKNRCGLLKNYYHLGLVIDENKSPKKLLLEGNLQEESLEVVYCCPESAPLISAEWEDPVCITEGQPGITVPANLLRLQAVSYSVENSPGIPYGHMITSTTNHFAGKINQDDIVLITITYGTDTFTHTATVRYSPDLSLPINFNNRIDIIPPIPQFPVTNNTSYGGASSQNPIRHFRIENLTNGEIILGGNEDTITEIADTFTLTGFSYFKELVTSDGDVYLIPYPATAQEIVDIVGVELDYAQQLVEDRINLDTENCFPPTLKMVTQTIHTRGADKNKLITLEGEGLHNFTIEPVFTSPITSYGLDDNEFTLQEIIDSIDFNFTPNQIQRYEIELNTDTYNSPTDEAIYLVKYAIQGAASFPYTISLGFGLQQVSKDFILAFDDFVFVANIQGDNWYAAVRTDNTDFTSFPLKTIQQINSVIDTVPINTKYIIHFYLTEPIVVTINDKPTSLTKQYIAFSDKSTDRLTALYLPSEVYNLEFLDSLNLSFKLADGNIEKTDVIWTSLTFKTITEIRNEIQQGNKTILIQNNTSVYNRAYNALLFNSELPYVNVAFDFTFKEFYIPREISELDFNFAGTTVTIRATAASVETTVSSLVDIQNWFISNSVNWAILKVSTTLPKTIKLR